MEKRGKKQSSYSEHKPALFLNSEHHHRHTHKLLYFITLLLIALILAIIISYPLYNQPYSPSEDLSSLAFDSTTCTWQDNHYEVCMSVSWDGPAETYVKPYIPGGESPDAVQKYFTKQFLYCQPVGTEDGYRVVRALLYQGQELLRDVGKGVACEDQPAAEKPLAPSASKKAYSFTDTAQFSVGLQETNVRSGTPWYSLLNTTPSQESTKTGRSSAIGIYRKTFSDPIESCTLQGTWITDNDPFGRQRQYCHDATGSFSSFADATQQYVTNNPDYFSWSGLSKPFTNPPAQHYDGYVIYMNTCSNSYHREPTFYVRGALTGFGTKELLLSWEYYDDETRPQVSFVFAITCTLRP